jgi:hypothetical protein
MMCMCAQLMRVLSSTILYFVPSESAHRPHTLQSLMRSMQLNICVEVSGEYKVFDPDENVACRECAVVVNFVESCAPCNCAWVHASVLLE